MPTMIKPMQEAVKLAKRLGIQPEQVAAVRGTEWKRLKSAAKDEKVRDCLKALHWTKGDVRAFNQARTLQKLRRKGPLNG